MRLLQRERRFASVNLPSSVQQGGVEAMVDLVQAAIAHPRFVDVLSNNVRSELARNGRKNGDAKWINRVASTPTLAPALQSTLLEVAVELRAVLQAEQAAGRLARADLHLDALLNRKGPKSRLMDTMQSHLMLVEGQRGPAFAVLLRPLKESIAHQLTLSQQVEMGTPAAATQATAAQLIHSGVSFLSSRRRCLQVATQLADSPPDHVAAFARRVESVPAAPLVPRQSQWAQRLNDRLRFELASCRYDAGANGALPRDLVHERVTEVFQRLFSTPGIAVYLNYFANERAVMRRVADGVRRGSITLTCISCPDYSGSMHNVDGKKEWRFDFTSLGTGVGVVAQKGFRYVDAWVKALQPAIPEVKLRHIMPTFEVASGFAAREPGQPLDYDAAVERIKASGEAIAHRYRAMGIDTESVLSCDVLPDQVFDEERARRANELLAAAADWKALAGLIHRVYTSRQRLYDSWQARHPGESAAEFAVRMQREVVPRHVAEYYIAGSLFTRDPATLMLAYDSSTMGEVHGLFGRPVMYGHDAATVDYEGAQD